MPSKWLYFTKEVTNPDLHTKTVKNLATKLGFNFCGISKAERLDDDAKKLEYWLNKGMNGKMKYMENHFDKRVDPSLLVPGAKSVISLLYNYYTPHEREEGIPKISKYAFGEDYHFVIKEKLRELVAMMTEAIGNFHGRIFVDSAPVLERSWAARSGLGWIGKNGNLINKEQGSFLFIAEIICDLELTPDSPVKDYCGTCTRCIDECPTQAILPGKVVDGSKCISYLTIELREEILSSFKGQMEGWAFGCDICQDVCPWNRFAKANNEKRFVPSEKNINLNEKEWLEMTDEIFEELFKHSPIQRTGLEGMKRNLSFIENNDLSKRTQN